MAVLHDYETPGCVCPHCGKEVDAALETAAGGPAPTWGDITVCAYCAGVAKYARDLTLVELTGSEYAQVMSDRRVVNAVAAVMAVNMDRPR